MAIGYSVWMLLLGVLGAANLIIAKKPDAKEVIAKISPYQGWIGAISALGGVWWIIYAVLNIGWLTSAPIAWATLAAVAGVQLCLGLLLGVGVIKTFVKQAEAQAKMNDMVTKLAPYQGILGLVAIGLGIWGLVSFFIF